MPRRISSETSSLTKVVTLPHRPAPLINLSVKEERNDPFPATFGSLSEAVQIATLVHTMLMGMSS